MRFGILGSVVQVDPPYSEGRILCQAGLIDASYIDDWQLDIQPTPLLRSLFAGTPPLEELYPLLVEYVLIYRYPDLPNFVDKPRLHRQLARLGLTADGLLTLRRLISAVTCPVI